MNVHCADGDHAGCPGGVAKWYAQPGDEVIDAGPLIASDGVGVVVRCKCPCHYTHIPLAVEAERRVHVPEA